MAIVVAYGGWIVGIKEGQDEGYLEGYCEGYEEGFTDANEQVESQTEVPTTNNGKFYSTRAAIRDISKVGDE